MLFIKGLLILCHHAIFTLLSQETMQNMSLYCAVESYDAHTCTLVISYTRQD